MKKRISTLMLAIIVAISTIFGFGISQTTVKAEVREAAPVYSLSFDAIGGKDVMPIGGWWGPYEQNYGTTNGNKTPNYNTDYYYQLLKECGLNTITVARNQVANSNGLEEVFRAMDLCQKYGFGYFVQDSTFMSKTTPESMLEQISQYLNHPACVGIHVTDEPKMNQFDMIASCYEIYRQLNIQNKYLFTNLYPIFYTLLSGTSESVTFKEYVTTFVEKVKPPFVSTDNYPFREANTGSDSERYLYQELSILRELAQENEIPFWAFVQAGVPWYDANVEQESVPVYPTEGEMIWNTNVNLAYGCKAIHYFTIFQVESMSWAMDDGRDFNRQGFIGVGGNINEWYYYAQKVNKQIAAIDHVLMNSCNMGVIPIGKIANGQVTGSEELESYRELISCDAENVIIGCFDYFGRTALYVVNNSATLKQTATLKFDNRYTYEVIQRAESKLYKGKQMSLNLEAGEGVLVVLK